MAKNKVNEMYMTPEFSKAGPYFLHVIMLFKFYELQFPHL